MAHDKTAPQAGDVAAYVVTKDHARVGASGLLVENDKLLMGFSKKWERWVIPGGGVDHMESYKTAVVREWAEETGLQIEWTGLRYIHEILYEPTKDHRILIYSDVRRTGGELTPGDDIAELKFFSRDEMAELQRTEKLTWVMEDVLTHLGWLAPKQVAA